MADGSARWTPEVITGRLRRLAVEEGGQESAGKF